MCVCVCVCVFDFSEGLVELHSYIGGVEGRISWDCRKLGYSKREGGGDSKFRFMGRLEVKVF